MNSPPAGASKTASKRIVSGLISRCVRLTTSLTAAAPDGGRSRDRKIRSLVTAAAGELQALGGRITVQIALAKMAKPVVESSASNRMC
jgi:hypothetical protein